MVSRTASASLEGVRTHLGLVGIAAESQRHRPHARESRVAVENACQRVLEGSSVVDPRADDDLAMDLDAPVEKDLQPSQAGGSLRIAEHVGPQLGVSRVDGHEERAQALGEDAFRVELREPGERREVPVEEREAVVVVFQVEAPSHALREVGR